MAKVLGAIFLILGFIGISINAFLYLNSSAFLPYNPAAPNYGLLDVGLLFPVVFFIIVFVVGYLLMFKSTEPEFQ